MIEYKSRRFWHADQAHQNTFLDQSSFLHWTSIPTLWVVTIWCRAPATEHILGHCKLIVNLRRQLLKFSMLAFEGDQNLQYSLVSSLPWNFKVNFFHAIILLPMATKPLPVIMLHIDPIVDNSYPSLIYWTLFNANKWHCMGFMVINTLIQAYLLHDWPQI
jgi:hypothetical protein